MGGLPVIDSMKWPLVLRRGGSAMGAAAGAEAGAELPRAILTLEPRLRHEGMPREVGLLLPTTDGPKRLIDAVAADPTAYHDAMLGLFLASPFLNLSATAIRLGQAGVAWIANLPSVAQQDLEFAQQLADVGLDHGRELECLAAFRDRGFKIAVVVADGPGAAAALAIEPEAIIVLPRVTDFAAGFPSLRQRGAAARDVAETARGAGWSGLLLGLGEASEADHAALWPEDLDGLVCRPQLA